MPATVEAQPLFHSPYSAKSADELGEAVNDDSECEGRPWTAASRRTDSPDDAGAGLTRREQAVLSLVSAGLSNRGIARHLGISEKTVNNHLSAIYAKIGAADRTQAALYAVTSERHAPPLSPVAMANLTSRETDVLLLITEGLSNRGIARHLGISEKTVKNHLSAIYAKIGAADRTQAALYAVGIRRGG